MFEGPLDRRRFLTSAAFTAVGVSVAARQPFLRLRSELNTSFRVGIAHWLPLEMMSDIRGAFAEPMARGLARELEIVRVTTDEILSPASRSLYDVVVTSTNFHPWLYPAHSFFNSLPYGLDASAKLAWLGSNDACVLQDRFFRQLGFKSHAIGVGSDRAGVLSTLELDKASLSGARIALGGFRATWLAKSGLVGTELTPVQQVAALVSGKLEISEPLPPSAVRVLAQAASGTALRYYEFPRIRTASTAHLLWRLSSWGSLDDKQRALSERLAASALAEVSRAWQARESSIASELRGRYGNQSVPESLVASMTTDAREHRALISSYSPFAVEVARSYEQAERSALTTDRSALISG